MKRRDFLISSAGFAALPLFVRPAFAAAGDVTLPQISGPLADTATKGVVVYGVAAQGYVAEEYFVTGTADVTEPVTMADAPDMNNRNTPFDLARRDFTLTVTAKAQSYVTRVIVYRPIDPAKASGRVIVEALHPNGGGKPTVFDKMNAFFMANGDTQVSVQHPITFNVVKKADPVRYAQLQAAHTTQIWGMLRDVGALLKSKSPGNPLRGQKVPALYMTGYSYTGVATATFANFHHNQARLADGSPIFDAYLPMANATYIRPLDVPVTRMNTQSDFNSFGGLANRREDSDDKASRYRLYEVSGASHVRDEVKTSQAAAISPVMLEDAAQPGRIARGNCQDEFPKDSHPNDFPMYGYTAAFFTNTYAWLEHGTTPPAGFLIETDDKGEAKLDKFGNALGGLRSIEVEAPFTHYGIGTGRCMLNGYDEPFAPAVLKELYGTPAAYQKKVADLAAHLVQQRLLTPISAQDAQNRASHLTF